MDNGDNNGALYSTTLLGVIDFQNPSGPAEPQLQLRRPGQLSRFKAQK